MNLSDLDELLLRIAIMMMTLSLVLLCVIIIRNFLDV